jgi:hypothetical protein
MKKLQKTEMKKIKGGQPPFCVTICNIEYNNCLARGGTLAGCRLERIACIDCECNNIGC